jgi:hypothetical protein
MDFFSQYLDGGDNDDLLAGGLGADVFKWSLAGVWSKVW